MKRWLIMIAILGALAAVGGVLVMVAGVIPITASSGHWAITEWILQFAKQRSVGTHSLGIELPNLDDPALIIRGAGHYESGCAPCHGSPKHKHPVVPGAMLPPPPYLPERTSVFEPKELFYMVKHGIKFTGMPAWPAQNRDDEVHAVVAFLLELPKLDVSGYRDLVGSEENATGPAAASGCARCHARDTSDAFPALAGQRAEYTFKALEAYAHGRRSSGIMQPIAASMREDEMRSAAEYYARLATAPARKAPIADSAAIARGAQIARNGIPEQRVPACAECHGPQPTRHNPAYPKLAGQHASYLLQQLELIRDRHRGGSEYAHLMDKVAPRLQPAQMRDVAAYYASLTASEE